MHIDSIIFTLGKLNAAAGKPAKKKAAVKQVSASAAPAVKANGHTFLTDADAMAFYFARQVRAMDLESRTPPITVETLVKIVQNYEKPHEGRVN